MTRTTTARATRLLLLPVSLVLIAACEDDPAAGPADAGDLVPLDGGPGRDAGADGDACVPASCTALGDVCGVQPDGCGGELRCGPCDCEPETFATDCPSAPCEVATGCEAGRCVYEPVTCGGDTCAGPIVADAGGLRACGADACALAFCAPSPSVVDGQVVYGNACVAPDEVACGVCGLGAVGCVEGAPACVGAPPLFGLDADRVSCAGDPDVDTFVFVDADAPAEGQDGTKARPFTSYAAARDAAVVRAARGLVLGGRTTFPDELRVIEGLSVYGGYTGWPDWRPDAEARPGFAPAGDARQVVAGWADGITLPTGLVRVRLVASPSAATRTAHDGRSAIALVARRSSGLVVEDAFLAALAEDGDDGADGRDGPPLAVAPRPGFGARHFPDTVCSLAIAMAPDVEPSGGSGMCLDGAPARPGGAGGRRALVTLGYSDGQDGGGGAPGGSALGPAGDGAAHPVPVARDGRDGLDEVARWLDAEARLDLSDARGVDGEDGALGFGGGGGRSGFTGRERDGAEGCLIGGAGGGGGAGGCGGEGGQGGGAGGWSVALLAVDSPGLVVRDTELPAGLPGLGGAGGAGGLAGGGQPGAFGGRGIAAYGGEDGVYAGEDGADGSDGQGGGRGGDGADGLGVGLFCVGAVPRLEGVVFAPGLLGRPSVERRGCDR